MAVTYQAVGGSNAGTASVNVSWPIGHITNDIGILVLESASAPWTTPSGWTLVNTSTISSTELNIYWKRAASNAEPAVATGIAIGADHVVARIHTFRGCVTTGSPILTSATSTKATASTSWSAPSITTTTTNEFVVYGVSRDNDSVSTLAFSDPTNANLVSPTEIVESATSLGNGGGFVLGYGVKTTPGATGTTTGTVTSSANSSITFSLAEQTATNYPLDVTVGAFTVGTTNTNLTASFLLNETTQTYSVGTSNLILDFTRLFDVSTGTFVLNGIDAGLLPTRILNQQTGTFTLSGIDLITSRSYQFDLATQEYFIDFKSSIIGKLFQLNTSTGSYVVNGTTTEFVKFFILDPTTGTFNIVYKPIQLSVQYPLNLTASSFVVTGIDAEFTRKYYLNPTTGIYTVDANGIDYFSDRNLIALPLDLVMGLQSNGDFFWYQTTNTIPVVKYKITKRNEWILGRATHMGRRGL